MAFSIVLLCPVSCYSFFPFSENSRIYDQLDTRCFLLH